MLINFGFEFMRKHIWSNIRKRNEDFIEKYSYAFRTTWKILPNTSLDKYMNCYYEEELNDSGHLPKNFLS